MKTLTFLYISMLFSVAVALGSLAVTAAPSPQENANLFTQDKLIVSSDQPSIQRFLVRGNLTAAVVSGDSRNVTLTSNTPETYILNVLLSYPGPYTTGIAIQNSEDGTMTNLPSYYVSSGDLNLTVTTVFQSRPGTGSGGPIGLPSFSEWVGQFGGAFPLWIKLLFLFIGLQFAYVGYRWMKFEDERRRLEGHLPPLDKGNKVYLWTDILFRSLLTAFALSLAVMVGEVLIILVSKYLFFVDLSLFSLVDFFSLFFIAALASIVYLAREGLERLFDLKPMMED